MGIRSKALVAIMAGAIVAGSQTQRGGNMKIRIEIDGTAAKALGPFPIEMLTMFAGLRGKKIWTKGESVTFEANKTNLAMLQNAEWEYPGTQVELVYSHGAAPVAKLPTQQAAAAPVRTRYKPKVPHLPHMVKVLATMWKRKAYAVLLEMGLCKTAIIIHDAGAMYLEGLVSGVLVLSPKGVHRQWIEEQIPQHLDASIRAHLVLWKQKPILKKDMHRKGCLAILSMNIDAIRTKKGFTTAMEFLKLHNGKSYFCIDESHMIKSPSADRTRAAIELGLLAAWRRICTGTPISKNVMDAWSQFKFLDVEILGHKYATSFRARYCIMGGFENRVIVGQRNVEEFYQLIAPHSYRLTKAEALNLPPKMYVKREYEPSEVVRSHYNNLKKTFMTEMSDGSIADVQNAAVALLRLQQVVLGYLPYVDADGEAQVETFDDGRLQEMLAIIEQVNGPVIIWSRFRNDIKRVTATLQKSYGKNSVVEYYGGTSNKDRAANKISFVNGHARFFNSNPSAGGVGTDGLQRASCQTVIYYSNSFNALHRWQSEDRTHRQGTKGTVTYFDLIAYRTVDLSILGNLRAKKSISDLTFDEIRSLITTS